LSKITSNLLAIILLSVFIVSKVSAQADIKENRIDKPLDEYRNTRIQTIRLNREWNTCYRG